MNAEDDATITAKVVREAAFPPSLRGYDPTEVDAVLDLIADALDRGERIDPAWLAAVEFRTTLRGYSRQTVDAFLEQLRMNL